MKKIYLFQFLVLLWIPLATFSQQKDNDELKKMFEDDQSSRMVADIDWASLGKNDMIREARAYELINSGKLITAKDHYHSAMI